VKSRPSPRRLCVDEPWLRLDHSLYLVEVPALAHVAEGVLFRLCNLAAQERRHLLMRHVEGCAPVAGLRATIGAFAQLDGRGSHAA